MQTYDDIILTLKEKWIYTKKVDTDMHCLLQ